MKSVKDNNSVNQNDSIARESVFNTLGMVCSSVGRTTVRLITNLPNKIKNHFVKKYNEYKRKPKRDSISRVYVLVGYTSKQHIEKKYNMEKYMMIFRRGLLVLIFVLLLFITINSITPVFKKVQYNQMFGIDNIKEMTKNDPFSDKPLVTDEEDENASFDSENVSTTPTPADLD